MITQNNIYRISTKSHKLCHILRSAKGKYYNIVFNFHNSNVHLETREMSISSYKAWHSIRCYQMVDSLAKYTSNLKGLWRFRNKERDFFMSMFKRNLLNVWVKKCDITYTIRYSCLFVIIIYNVRFYIYPNKLIECHLFVSSFNTLKFLHCEYHEFYFKET